MQTNRLEIVRELPGLTYSLVELLYVISCTRPWRDGTAPVRKVRDKFAQLHGPTLSCSIIRQDLEVLSEEQFIVWFHVEGENIDYSRVGITPLGLEELNRKRTE